MRSGFSLALTYIPAGWMGDAKALRLDPAWTVASPGKPVVFCLDDIGWE